MAEIEHEAVMAQPHEPGLVIPCLGSFDVDEVRQHLADDTFFWLDLCSPSDAEIKQLGGLFGFHPLALEDTIEFGQRPKLDPYGNYALMVFYGAHEPKEGDPDDQLLLEVHMFVSGSYLVTIHRDPLPLLADERERLQGRVVRSEQFLLYRVFDALTDSFFPVLARMDDEIDELEEAMLAQPSEYQLQRLFAIKRQLVALRKVVTPQRDLFARGVDQIAALPGLVLDQRDYFRDVYDHLIRISDLIDSYRDLMSSATDLYLSTVGNRQNEVMKQLTIIGSIFLPLSFLTGFFGMNFGWLVNHGLTHTWTFWVLGIGSMACTTVGMIIFFKRKGWL